MLTYKYLTATSLALALTFSALAQSMPQMPSITAPNMPTVSAPTIGSPWYSPGNSYAGSQNQSSSTQNQAQTSSVSETSTTAPESQQTSVLDALSAFSEGDIRHLGNTGLLSTLLSADSTALSRHGVASYAEQSSAETTALLHQMLSEIEELKKQNASSQSTTNATQTPQSQSPQSTQQIRKSRLLRFSVNGYDVLRTCRAIYISDVQSDGTFLVTGDRRYVSDGKTRAETFHLLFQREANDAGISNYNAKAAVSQDYQNEYSFLYQLSQRNDLSAMRTGNFVSMRTQDPDWQLEMLIDLGDAK